MVFFKEKSSIQYKIIHERDYIIKLTHNKIKLLFKINVSKGDKSNLKLFQLVCQDNYHNFE